MSLTDIYKEFGDESEATLDWFKEQLSSLRTGRITTNLVETISIEHYGTKTPLNGLASITSSDARTIVVSPWDESALPAIEKALSQAQIGAQPVIDGKIIRLNFPSLTDDIRKQTVKQLHQLAEEARVRLRRSRDDGLKVITNGKEAGDFTEDDYYQGKKELDDRIHQVNEQIDEIVSTKETDIAQV